MAGDCGAPEASSTTSAPSPVAARIPATASSRFALIVCEAPRSRAFASRASSMSTAISSLKPEAAAAPIRNEPMPPAPITASDWPGVAPLRRSPCSATASGCAMAAASSEHVSGTTRQSEAGVPTYCVSPPWLCSPSV